MGWAGMENWEGQTVESPRRGGLTGVWRVALEQLDDGGITHGPVDKLLDGEFVVQVFVHLSEDLVGPLLGGRLIVRHLHGIPHHLVNCLQSWSVIIIIVVVVTAINTITITSTSTITIIIIIINIIVKNVFF